MLWPLILPLQITVVLLVVAVAVLTVLAPRAKRLRTFVLGSLLACALFVPALFGVSAIVDVVRFGTFHYTTAAEVDDFRVNRYLPPAARDITLHKSGPGYCARYTLEEAALRAYLDSFWATYGTKSSMTRDSLHDGQVVGAGDIDSVFRKLDWVVPKEARRWNSPVEDDGGGATYYFDPATSTVLQRAGYW
jgi:hypothetical protein